MKRNCELPASLTPTNAACAAEIVSALVAFQSEHGVMGPVDPREELERHQAECEYRQDYISRRPAPQVSHPDEPHAPSQTQAPQAPAPRYRTWAGKTVREVSPRGDVDRATWVAAQATAMYAADWLSIARPDVVFFASDGPEPPAWGIFNPAYPDYEVWVWHALTPARAAKVTAHEIAHLRQALAGYVFPEDEDGREPFEAAADRFAYDFLARFTPALQRCLRTWA